MSIVPALLPLMTPKEHYALWTLIILKALHDSSWDVDLLGAAAAFSESGLVLSKDGIYVARDPVQQNLIIDLGCHRHK